MEQGLRKGPTMFHGFIFFNEKGERSGESLLPEPIVLQKERIFKGDTVLHTLSGLYYKCENAKHERWMNESKFYVKVPPDTVPESYFAKQNT